MFTKLTVEEINKSVKGKLLQGNTLMRIKGLSINSRSVQKNMIFVAIKGKRLNGHVFIRSAIRRGAVAVIVSQRIVCPKHIAVIYVGDTTKALGHLAAAHRRRFNIPVVAITGSTGKTTTKELTAVILAKRFKVLKNVKTENNQYGVALTLLKLNPSHQAAVLELGTNQPGDIRWLAQMARPSTVIFTNIGESHLARLKSPRGVFREKVQMIKYMDPRGSIIFNDDDPYFTTIKGKKYSQKIIRYGIERKSSRKAVHIIARSNHQIQFRLNRQTFTVNSPAYHNVYNALAAISCGLLYKIRYNDIKAVLARFKFRDARQEIIRCGRSWLIDDSYNANPLSLQSAVKTLDALRVKGKRILVCADMLELGPRSKDLHRSAGRMIGRSAADVVLTIGRHARYMALELKESQENIEIFHCDDLSEVHRRLRKVCYPGDAVLVKGSRGMRMERTVAFLKTYLI